MSSILRTNNRFDYHHRTQGGIVGKEGTHTANDDPHHNTLLMANNPDNMTRTSAWNTWYNTATSEPHVVRWKDDVKAEDCSINYITKHPHPNGMITATTASHRNGSREMMSPPSSSCTVPVTVSPIVFGKSLLHDDDSNNKPNTTSCTVNGDINCKDRHDKSDQHHDDEVSSVDMISQTCSSSTTHHRVSIQKLQEKMDKIEKHIKKAAIYELEYLNKLEDIRMKRSRMQSLYEKMHLKIHTSKILLLTKQQEKQQQQNQSSSNNDESSVSSISNNKRSLSTTTTNTTSTTLRLPPVYAGSYSNMKKQRTS